MTAGPPAVAGAADAPASPPPFDLPVDVDAVVAAVLACPHVSSLSGGRIGEVATYLPGRSIAGIRLTDDEVQVHIVARYGPTADEISAQVRTAVTPLAAGRAVAVGIDDLDLDPAPHIDPLGATGPDVVTTPPVPRVR